jgi:hypothetical protein
MRKALIFLMGISLIFYSVKLDTASAFGYQKRFSNCEIMRRSTDPFGTLKGVALNEQSVGYTGAIVDPNLYRENIHLDTDKDGVACEGKIYDLKLTSTTSGVAAAYSACKSRRAADQNFINITSQIDRYYSESDTWLATIPMHEQASFQMQKAAGQNPIFKDGAISAKFNLELVRQTYQYSLKGKQFSSGKSNFDFDNWCSLFGMYSSHKGMFPPIDLKFPKIAKTPLNGARLICQQLFVIAPKGELLYSGNDSISLSDCDRNARKVGSWATSDTEARNEMLKIYFTFYEFWCWGRNNCKTRWDIR